MLTEQELGASLEKLFDRPQGLKARRGSGSTFWRHSLVPVEPVLEDLPAPVVPSPPKLDQNLSAKETYRKIVKFWVGCVGSKYGKSKSGALLGTLRNPERSRNFKLISAAAEKFREHKLAPASWIAFSCDMWHNYMKRPETTPPPVKWVFDPARIEKWRGWARAETRWYDSKRVLYTKTYKTLLTRYSLMKHALSRLPANASDEAIEKVVDKYFPEGLYKQLKKKIRKETREIQEIINDSLDSGEWLWNTNWNLDSYGI